MDDAYTEGVKPLIETCETGSFFDEAFVDDTCKARDGYSPTLDFFADLPRDRCRRA
jgi:hypothetical protein